MSPRSFPFACHAHSGLQVRGIRNSGLSNWIPELAEALRLSRSQEGEVGLIIRVNTGHQLDIRTIAIGETAIPGVPELVIAPRPLLFARSNVVIGYMHHACARRMIVAAEKIFARVGNHVTGRNWYVGIPAQVVGRV